MTTWPCVLWAGAKRDGGGKKHRGTSRDLSVQISFRTVWVTFPVCTSSCTHTHFQSNKLHFFFFFRNSLMSWHTFWKCFFSFLSFRMNHSCSILRAIFFQVNAQGHAAISSCWGCSSGGAWMILLSLNRIYYFLFIIDGELQQRWLLCTRLGCLVRGFVAFTFPAILSPNLKYIDKNVKSCLATSSIWFLSPLLCTPLVWPKKAGIVPTAIKKCDWKNENTELCPQNFFPSYENVFILPNLISPFAFLSPPH